MLLGVRVWLVPLAMGQASGSLRRLAAVHPLAGGGCGGVR